MAAAQALSRNCDLPAALADVRARYVAQRRRSAALHARARGVMPGGNTRSGLAYGPFPTAMARGEGCRLWDIDGRGYLDLCGEYTAGLFGHTEPLIQQAVIQAVRDGVSLAAVGAPEVELARLLRDRFPSIDLVRFTNSGTEANVMALMAARAFTGRSKVLAFRGGYHGSVLTFPVEGTSKTLVPIPFVMADYNDPGGATAAARAHGADLAAIIVEPMLGSGGCIPAERAFLESLRTDATALGALLVFDEVMTSRMGAGGLQARLGITPDLTTLGKYVGGGMSFGAFGGRTEVMDLFSASLSHSGTFNNNVLSMAAGCVAMGEVFTPEAVARLWDRGERMRAALDDACAAAGVPMHFAGLGSMATVHFRRGPLARPYLPTSQEEGRRERCCFPLLAAGIYLPRRGMVALSLPVTDTDVDAFVAAVAEFAALRAPLLAQVDA